MNGLSSDLQQAKEIFNRGPVRPGDDAPTFWDTFAEQYGDRKDPEIRKLVANGLLNKGNILLWQGNDRAAIEVYTDLKARYGDVAGVERWVRRWIRRASKNGGKGWVAKTLINQGLSFLRNGDNAAALGVYDELLGRYGDSAIPEVKEVVEKALLALLQQGNSQAAADIYDELVRRYCNSDVHEVQRLVAKMLLAKGRMLLQLGNSQAAVEVYDDLVTRYGNTAISEVQAVVAKALLVKGRVLLQLGNSQAAVEVYDDLVTRYGNTAISEVQAVVAKALLVKGRVLLQLGSSQAAVEVYDDLVTRYGNSDVHDVQRLVARGLLDKECIPRAPAASQAVVRIYDSMAERYGYGIDGQRRGHNSGDHRAPEELMNKARKLLRQGNNQAAVEVYDNLARRYGDVPAVQTLVANALVNEAIALARKGQRRKRRSARQVGFSGNPTSPVFPSAAGWRRRRQTMLAMVFGILAIEHGDLSPWIRAVREPAAEVAQPSTGDEPPRYAFYKLLEFADSDVQGVRTLVQEVLAHGGAMQILDSYGGRLSPKVQKAVAEVLIPVSQSYEQSAIAIYGKLLDRYGDSAEPAVQELVATGTLHKVLIMSRCGETAGATDIYDKLHSRYGDTWIAEKLSSLSRYCGDEGAIAAYNMLLERKEPSVHKTTLGLLFSKGLSLSRLGNHADAIATYNRLIERYGRSEDPSVQKLVIEALFSSGVSLSRLDNDTDEIAAYTNDGDEPSVQKPVLGTLFSKGVPLSRLGNYAEAIATYNRLIEQYSRSEDPSVQKLVIEKLFSSGVSLSRLGNDTDAIAAYNMLLERTSDRGEPSVRKMVVEALFRKGVSLSILGNDADAVATFTRLIERFGESTVPEVEAVLPVPPVEVAEALFNKDLLEVHSADSAVQERMAKALSNKGRCLWRLSNGRAIHRKMAATEVYDKLSELYGESKDPKVIECVMSAWMSWAKDATLYAPSQRSNYENYLKKDLKLRERRLAEIGSTHRPVTDPTRCP